jgi:nitrate reductase NapD
MNVSSLIVSVAQGNVEKALEVLSQSGLCEVHFHDALKGTIVVTIEGKDTGEEMDKMKAIEKLPHVLGAALVYAYGEEELDEAMRKIVSRSDDAVPDMLNKH